MSFRLRLGRFLGFTKHPEPPPARGPADRALYGLAQPVLGLRLVLRDRQLLEAAVKPAVLLAGFCALAAALHIGDGKTFLRRFYTTFALLAPLPSIVFAPHYARMAVAVRQKLGFGDCNPKREPLFTIAFRGAAQFILVAAGVAPVVFIVAKLPGFGEALAAALAFLWGLQWVVVDAFDDARVLKPGETLRQQEKAAQFAPRPWFVRFFYSAGKALPSVLGSASNAFARFVDRLSISWREEMALIEKNPALAAGFALSTGALLATPVLNLFFRPIILVASAHLLGHLEAQEDREAREHAERAAQVLAMPMGQLTPVPPKPQ